MNSKKKLEVITNHVCRTCGDLIGQTSATRAWLFVLREPCENCPEEAALLYESIDNQDLKWATP